MSIGRWLRLLGLGVGVFVVLAFVLQNSGRRVDLSLDLYVAAFRLSHPIPVTWLMGGCFVLGAFLAAFLGALRRRALRDRIARLEQDALLQRATAGEWAAPKSQ